MYELYMGNLEGENKVVTLLSELKINEITNLLNIEKL